MYFVLLWHCNFTHEYWNKFYPFISHISNSTDVGEKTAIKKRIWCQKCDSSIKYNLFSCFTESAIFKVTFQNTFQRQAHFKSNVYHMHNLAPSCYMLLPLMRLLEKQYLEDLAIPLRVMASYVIWCFRLRYLWLKHTRFTFKDVSFSFLFFFLIWKPYMEWRFTARNKRDPLPWRSGFGSWSF